MSFTLGWILFVLGSAIVAGCIFAITVRGDHEHGAAGDHGHDAGGHASH
jgi:hypothetical protein